MCNARFWLAAALTLTAFVISVALNAQSNSDHSRQLAGSWIVAVSPTLSSGIPAFVSVTSIMGDGRLLNVHPGFGTSVGEWTRKPSGSYAVTFVGLIPADNTVLKSRVRATLDVDSTGHSFTGPFQTDIFDALGNLVQSFSGTVTGVRFDVEPL